MIELMTIGYENMPLEGFFRMLENRRVSMVVDLQELYDIRRPAFAKAVLEESLARRGIKYEHIAGLGCLGHVRHECRDDSAGTDSKHRCNADLETEESALARLAGLIQERRCCLMCQEEDYNVCHRSLVAQRLAGLVGDRVRIHHLSGPTAGHAVRRDAGGFNEFVTCC